jgi:hypothetical protein
MTRQIEIAPPAGLDGHELTEPELTLAVGGVQKVREAALALEEIPPDDPRQPA